MIEKSHINKSVLLPCPFCGGDPILDDSSADCRVICNNCDAESDPRNNYDKDRTLVQAIKQWNTRHPL
jgi:Lar family restriction alleviation protein